MASSIKVAITFENQMAYLLEISIGKSLTEIVQDICTHYNLPNPLDYALRFSEPNDQSFVTETNQHQIKNGTIMVLTPSPIRMAQTILDSLNSNAELLIYGHLKDLSELSKDITFVQQFIDIHGLNKVILMIQNNEIKGETLSYLLKSFVELMDHGIVSWNLLDKKFIEAVCSCINSLMAVDVSTIQSALEILESIVLYCPDKYSCIESEVSVRSLIPHLESSNTEVQGKSIGLINAFFLKGDSTKRKELYLNMKAMKIRYIILTSIIHKGVLSREIILQLSGLQSHLFSLLDDECRNPVDIATIQVDLQLLRSKAFDIEVPVAAAANNIRQSQLKDFVKLGFQNEVNPVDDFMSNALSRLALKNMVYFSQNHRENYTKVVLENSCREDNHDLPFAHASIELTKLIVKILCIGEQPSEESQLFQPMFFTMENPFEEFYCTCIQLLNKTWKEMKASTADFTKVLSVVQEQIIRALRSQPTSFDQFRNKLAKLTYQDITQIWQDEQKIRDEWESQAKPILELRERIEPEIIELIKKQRLNYLVEGARFNLNIKPSRRSEKFFFCRLSHNHKTLHYGECEENSTQTPTIEQLAHKIAVNEIKDLLTGRDCPHVKDNLKKKANVSLAFTLVPEDGCAVEKPELLNFLAVNAETANIWLDGLNVLLKRPMTSVDMKNDLETLLSMEIKLRLLDTEGITIPNTPPNIPNDPPNYDFSAWSSNIQ